jgi:dTDP-4-dehydrorhamnose reductase
MSFQITEEKIIFTGGSGLLGSEFKKRMPGIDYPASRDFDVTNYDQMDNYIKNGSYGMVIHAAAFTSPPLVDKDPIRAIEVNIVGTANVVKLCAMRNLKLIYISTDYMFSGDKGDYKENDPMFPVNKYAWSKLGGECAVRMYDNSLIIRTSFGPVIFQYEKAFVDQWTSRESVDKIVSKMLSVIEKNITGVIHIGGERKTVFKYAKDLDPNKSIGELSRNDVNFVVPIDTSLNTDKYKSLTEK